MKTDEAIRRLKNLEWVYRARSRRPANSQRGVWSMEQKRQDLANAEALSIVIKMIENG